MSTTYTLTETTDGQFELDGSDGTRVVMDVPVQVIHAQMAMEKEELVLRSKELGERLKSRQVSLETYLLALYMLNRETFVLFLN